MTPEEKHDYDTLMANELRLNQIDKEERIKMEKASPVLTLGQLNDVITDLEEQIDTQEKELKKLNEERHEYVVKKQELMKELAKVTKVEQ